MQTGAFLMKTIAMHKKTATRENNQDNYFSQQSLVMDADLVKSCHGITDAAFRRTSS
jgi:hypothetical protein